MLADLVDRLFLRALQFVLVGVLFGLAFFPVRGRGSMLDLLVAGALLTVSTWALISRGILLAHLRRRPGLTLLFPGPALVAVALDGGTNSVWTPLVATTVGVPATLGLPWLSLGSALAAATGQAAAALLNRGDTTTARLLESAIFNAIGTVAVGVGIALSVATMAEFLQRRRVILKHMHEAQLLIDQPAASSDAPVVRQLERSPRTRLSPAELRVVSLMADGRAPKQIAADLGVKITTIRTHISAAKRKTHSRTQGELVGVYIVERGEL